MKTLKIALMTLVAACTLVACDKETTAEMIEGSYTGYTEAKFQYSPNPIYADDEKMTISVNGSIAVDIAGQFAQWGNLSASGVECKLSGDNVKLTGEGKLTMLGHGGGDPTTYDVEISVSEAKDRSAFDLTLNVPSVMGGTVIAFRNGKAPQTEE